MLIGIIKRKKEDISHKRRVYRTTLEFRPGIQTKEEQEGRERKGCPGLLTGRGGVTTLLRAQQSPSPREERKKERKKEKEGDKDLERTSKNMFNICIILCFYFFLKKVKRKRREEEGVRNNLIFISLKKSS